MADAYIRVLQIMENPQGPLDIAIVLLWGFGIPGCVVWLLIHLLLNWNGRP